MPSVFEILRMPLSSFWYHRHHLLCLCIDGGGGGGGGDEKIYACLSVVFPFAVSVQPVWLAVWSLCAFRKLVQPL